MSDADFYILHGHEAFVGPCVHGRDPWTRCDECGEGNAVDALLKRLEKAEANLALQRLLVAVANRTEETDRCAVLEGRLAAAESRLAEVVGALDEFAPHHTGLSLPESVALLRTRLCEVRASIEGRGGWRERLAEITRAVEGLAKQLDGYEKADGRTADDMTQSHGTRCHCAGRCYAWREAARDLRSLLGTHGGEGEAR